MEVVVYPNVYPPKHRHACVGCDEIVKMKPILKAEHGDMSGRNCRIVFDCNKSTLNGTLHNGGGPVVEKSRQVNCPGKKKLGLF